MTFNFKSNYLDNECAVPYERCAAKTCSNGRAGTTVFDHCRYAGSVAVALLSNLTDGVRECFPENIGLLVALHDIGKVSPGFQGKYFPGILEECAPKWLGRHRSGRTETDHAAVGAAAYLALAKVEKSDAEVQAIAWHHGVVRTNLICNTDGEVWQRERIRLAEALAGVFGGRIGQPIEKKCWRLLAGIVCVADWVASNEQCFPSDGKPIPADQLDAHAARVLSAIGFSAVSFREGFAFGDMFQCNGRRFVPRSEQSALMEIVSRPGVYIMEATMGAGKTEAALAAAYAMIASGQNAGIYFALPTRLTSDRIYSRMSEFLGRVAVKNMPVRLSHGRAWLDGYQIGGTGTDGHLPSWFSPAKRGLLYPFAVGTIDQALLAAMNVKHSFVRLFGLAGKVVILDEVHSYDMYTGSLVKALVRDLREVGCTVIILSATLTRAMRDVLLGCETPIDAPYPLVTGNINGELVINAPRVDAMGKRIAIQRIEGADAIIANALSQARIGCNVLCVANTVRQAQNWYGILKSMMNEDDGNLLRVGLLHSRFPDFRRSAIEAEWMSALGRDGENRPHGSILVSTQIVEQSVDIDADYLISEVAPIDMLFQRMGRLWRHERDHRPIANPICALAFDGLQPDLAEFTVDAFRSGIGAGSCCVYAPYVLLRTLRVLEGRAAVSIPDELRPLLESVYAESNEVADSVPFAFKVELEEKKREMQCAAQAAEAAVTSLPAMDDADDAPPTRYGSRKSASLLLVKSCDEGVGRGRLELGLMNGVTVHVDAACPDFGVTKALYANVVTVPMNKVLGRVDRDREHHLLARHFHAGEMPFVCRVEDDCNLVLAFSGEATGLAYREELGVYDATLIIEDESVGSTGNDQPLNLEGADW